MFSYDEMRQIIADSLQGNILAPKALDTAIMSACKAAYNRGLADGMSAQQGDTHEVLPFDDARRVYLDHE